MKLQGKTIVITGASSGIGKAFALLSAKDKANIVLVARSQDKLDQLATEIINLGSKAIAVPADVTKPEQVKEMFNQTLKHFGCVEVVFNNAGLGFVDDIFNMEDEKIKSQVDVNLLGSIYVAKYASITMVKQKFGHLINTSSVAGLISVPQWSVYCATKWGITGFTDAIRMDLKKHGVKVTSLHPGAVKTDFFEKGNIDMDVSSVKDAMTPEEVARAVYDAIFTDKQKIVVPSIAKSYSFLYKFMPSLTQQMIEKMTK